MTETLSNKLETEPKRPRILITGAKGRIGSILCRGLAEEFDIVRLDIVGNTDNKTIFVADIANDSMLHSTLQDMESVESIIHLAANPDDRANWDEILSPNIAGTINIYEWARKNGVKRVVFASSTHIFGKYPEFPDKPSNTPISVTAPHRPDGPYGISKAFGEDVARYYYEEHGIESIIIRIGAVDNDDRSHKPYHLLWLSHQDVIQIFRLALTTLIPFGIYFAISAEQKLFDMQPTYRELGFKPQK